MKMALTMPRATAGRMGAMAIMAGTVVTGVVTTAVVPPTVPAPPATAPPVPAVAPPPDTTVWRRLGPRPLREGRAGSRSGRRGSP